MGLKPIKYIQFDDQKGKLYASDRQSLLVPVDIVKTINDIFEQLVGDKSARTLVAKIGQGMGQGYARSLKNILSKEEASISEESKARISIDAIFMESGWGQAKIKELDLEKGVFKVTVSNTPTQSVLKEDGFDLEGGIMLGIIKEVSGIEGHYSIERRKNSKKVDIKVTQEDEDTLKQKEKMALLSRQQLQDKIDEATQTISEEKEKLSSIITSLADGLIMVDDKGLINIVNPQAEDYMGISKEELTGKKLKDSGLCSCFNELYTKIKKTTKKKAVIREMSMNCCPNKEEKEKDKNDQYRYYNIVAKAVLNSDNKMIGCVFAIHDITREKVLDKMKNEFISIAAHQLRTPLSGIHWSLQMILDGEMGEVSDEVKEYLQRTLNSNNRLIKLVNDLLNVSRIEEGRFVYRPKKVSVEDVLQDLISGKKEEAHKRNIKVKVDTPEKKLPKIQADEEKLQLAFSNVLDNAIKYSYDGGEVNIKLSRTKKKGKEHIKAVVCDQGIGIKEEDMDQLFAKFCRGSNAAKTDTEGSGLGLFIVKNIVEAHSGRVQCDPRKEGRGTCFTIELPVNNNLK